MNNSESDPSKSGQVLGRYDLSDDIKSSSLQDTYLHDNSDAISLAAESEGERYYPTKAENSFSLDGSMTAYCQKYFHQHQTEQKTASNVTI